MKYLKRILGLPFFLMLNIIGIFFHLCKISRAFILYGGEAMAYDKKTTPKMIADIYSVLENDFIMSLEKDSKLKEFDKEIETSFKDKRSN